MKRIALSIILMLAVSSAASAQAANITQYTQQVFAPGVNPVTGAPQWTNVYQAASVACNQAPITVTGTVVNPTRLEFDDSANTGKVCIVSLATTLLSALPNGVGYTSTLTQTDSLGQVSPRSAASNPFTQQGAPNAPTGFKIVP